MSAIFYHNDGQKRLAQSSKDREASRRGERIVTSILPFSGFTLAEDYHQKHFLQGQRLFRKEFRALYPTTRGLVSSTAAARVNGFLGGNGSRRTLEKEIEGYGLSDAAERRLRSRAGGLDDYAVCPIPGQIPD